MIQLLLSAFIIGLLGSFHCVGMCGAIALSLPIKSLPPYQQKLGLVLYNLGRVITYSIIGVLFGFIGRTFYLGGFQQWLSIVLGLFILTYLFAGYFKSSFIQFNFIAKLNIAVQKILGSVIVKQSLYNTFNIGLLNGLLPCGMVYFALAGALASGSISKGILFMVMFGIGTIPLMLLVSYFGIFINIAIRNKVKRAMPYFMFLIGVLFILRGLSLNIPFVSPLIENKSSSVMSCH